MKTRFVLCNAGGIWHYIKEYKPHWWNRWKIEMDGSTPRIYLASFPEKQEWENPKEDVQTRFAFYTYKDEPEVVYLSNVFVEESSRHQGLGTIILKAAEMVAKTYGATTIRLRVRPDSPAKAWYLNRGYIYMTFDGEYQWLEKYLSQSQHKADQKPEIEEEQIKIDVINAVEMHKDLTQARKKEIITHLYKQDKGTIELAEDHAFLAGADWQKEQMMKEAVEIGTTYIYWEQDGDRAFPAFDPPVEDLLMPGIISQRFNDGDKVRIIIVKE